MFAFIRRCLVLAALAAVCFILPVSAQTTPLEKVVVTLTRHHAYFVDGRRVKESQVEPLLTARAKRNTELVAIIQCDKSVAYARVVELYDLVKRADIQTVMLADAPPAKTPRRRHFRR